MRVVLYLFLVVIAPFAGTWSAHADGADVAYSSTARGKGCRIIQQPLPSNQDDHAPVISHCGGTAGFGVRIEYLGATVHVKIAKGDLTKAPLTLGAGFDVGPVVEWRGVRATNGFRPHAAIIRLIFTGENKRQVSVLAVIRTEANRACAAGFLDAAAVPNANEEARSAADRMGSGFACASDTPMIIGPRTALVEEAASRAGVTAK